MNTEVIKIRGARENNLKNINIDIPKYKIVAITGVSGSGKSSFVMDILQRESQRQYMESMGLVTDGLNKPKVDSIQGLSPSISIGQRVLSKNPRSTVGTYTEILTYIRILYAKLGVRICKSCGKEIMPSFEIDDEEIDYTDAICPHCKERLQHLSMASFSFNKIEGACESCKGLGKVKTVDYSKLIDKNKTIAEGGFFLWSAELFGEHYANSLKKCGEHYGFNFDVSKKIGDFNEIENMVFLRGVDSEKFKEIYPNIKKPKRVADGYIEGVMNYVEKKVIESETKKLNNPILNSAMSETSCKLCNGSRLGHDGRTTKLFGKTITEISKVTLVQLYEFIINIKDNINDDTKTIGEPIIQDILKRIKAIVNIGLGYLSIDRTISTLSGGESQRIRLASILDSGLTGVLYILDEPTTGLHPRDSKLLLESIKRLRDIGNTVIVVEHNMDFVAECDYIIDFGPDSGCLGGEVVASGDVNDITKSTQSRTGKYLTNIINKDKNKYATRPTEYEDNQIKQDKIKGKKEPGNMVDGYLKVIDAKSHNLKSISIDIPLNQLVAFTGVSGSGKSSLVFDVINKFIMGEKTEVENIIGVNNITGVIKIDQSPIGRQTRSNIATYTEVFTLIREFYSSLKEAKSLKLKPSHFSFNVKGGRCEKCEGLGVISLDMQFLEDVEVTCPVCKGQRFSKKVLSVKHKDKNISDILNQTVLENLEFFADMPDIIEKLKTLNEVGLSYLKLGQSTATLSGGECQRIKLSKELAKINKGHILYLLDEPTTGLHPCDTKKLLKILKGLVKSRNTVFVIEHDTKVISESDYIIELGPNGGESGGEVIFAGTMDEILNSSKSIIKTYLK